MPNHGSVTRQKDMECAGLPFHFVSSEAPRRNLDDVVGEHANLVGIINKDAVGAFFLLNEAGERAQISATSRDAEFNFDGDAVAERRGENEIDFGSAAGAVEIEPPSGGFDSTQALDNFFDNKTFEGGTRAGARVDLIDLTDVE